MIAGWYRCPGALTTPKGSDVVANAAPSHDHAKPLWPWRSLHGAKWSEHIAASNPTCSARRTASRSSAGWACSCEAWKPTTVTGGSVRVCTRQPPTADDDQDERMMPRMRKMVQRFMG